MRCVSYLRCVLRIEYITYNDRHYYSLLPLNIRKIYSKYTPILVIMRFLCFYTYKHYTYQLIKKKCNVYRKKN